MTIYNSSDFGFSIEGQVPGGGGVTDVGIRLAAWVNVERGLEIGENDSADAIYTDAFDLALGGALKVTSDWAKARKIATEVAMCFAQP